jgi:hypothetical protein
LSGKRIGSFVSYVAIVSFGPFKVCWCGSASQLVGGGFEPFRIADVVPSLVFPVTKVFS